MDSVAYIQFHIIVNMTESRTQERIVTAISAQERLSLGRQLNQKEKKILNAISADLDNKDSRLKEKPPESKPSPVKKNINDESEIQQLSHKELKELFSRQGITHDEYRNELARRATAIKTQSESVINSARANQQSESTSVLSENTTTKLLEQRIQQASIAELSVMMAQGTITKERYDAELIRHKDDKSSLSIASAGSGIPVEYRNFSPSQTEKFINNKVPQSQRDGLLAQLKSFKDEGDFYSVSLRKDNRGYSLVRFQTPSPWTYVKKNAEQSVTQSIRHEIGKGGNRLINPDYSHNEIIAQYKLIRAALPPGTSIHKILEKTDGIISAGLNASGLTVEGINLLVNAIRGALLEAPELRYKVAALLPDDLVRQTAVAAVRTSGNTIREFIHKKYHLPDRPKKTPVMVNTLDQIKPEHYRAQDAQKVGVDMRDLSREKAKEFILNNVPIEKQESALETINKLPGSTFGVQIMDSGWVRISASAREPRTYDNRPRYGSYNATDATKMP